MCLMFCCSFFFKFQNSERSFDLTLNVMQKVENSLSSKKKKKRKKTACIPLEQVFETTPSLEVFRMVPSLHMRWFVCYRGNRSPVSVQH